MAKTPFGFFLKPMPDIYFLFPTKNRRAIARRFSIKV